MISAWKDLGKLPRQIWFMALAFLINKAGTMALPFLVIYLTKHLGFSPTKAGTIVGVYGAGALATAPVGGWLSDRFGEKPIMVGCLTISGTLLLLYPLAGSYEAVLLLTVLWAMATEMFRPAAFSFVASIVRPEDRKSAYALNRLAINLGMSIGPAIGGLLVSISFRALYLVDGLTTLAAAIVLGKWLVPRERKEGAPKESVAAALAAALRSRPLVLALLAFLPVMIVFFQNDSSMPLYLVRDLKLNESTYGLLFTVNTLMIIAFELQLNLAMNHWPHHRSLALGALFFGIGFGSMTFAHTLPAVIATVVLWTIGEMILFPAMAAYISDIAPAERRGSFLGLYSASFSLAQVIGAPTGAALLQWGGPNVLWPTCFGLGLLSAILLSGLKRQPGS